jgi:HTH DNA binding domain
VDNLTEFVGKAVKEVQLAEIVAFHRAGADETALIMRVRFKDRTSKPNRLRLGPAGRVQVLERAKDGTWTIYWGGRTRYGRS